MKHKYNAKRTQFNNRSYGSKLEASYAQKLEIARKSGDLLFYLEQVPFRLPGGVIYRIDFVEFWAPKNGDQGEVIFTEVKGLMTPQAKNKIDMVTDLFNIDINIVKKT